MRTRHARAAASRVVAFALLAHRGAPAASLGAQQRRRALSRGFARDARSPPCASRRIPPGSRPRRASRSATRPSRRIAARPGPSRSPAARCTCAARSTATPSRTPATSSCIRAARSTATRTRSSARSCSTAASWTATRERSRATCAGPRCRRPAPSVRARRSRCTRWPSRPDGSRCWSIVGIGVLHLRFAESRRRVGRARARASARSLLAGIATQLALAPALALLCVGLALTILGALLIPFAVVAYVLAAAGLVTLGLSGDRAARRPLRARRRCRQRRGARRADGAAQPRLRAAAADGPVVRRGRAGLVAEARSCSRG